MLTAPITLTPEQIQDHKHYLDLMQSQFGDLGSEKTSIRELVDNLKSISGLTLFIPPSTLEEMMSRGRPKQSENDQTSPLQLAITSSRICTLINTVFFAYRKEMMQRNEKVYYACQGYLLLLNTLLGANVAFLYGNSTQADRREEKEKFINKCADWMMIFEMSFLPSLKGTFCQDLRATLVKTMISLKTPLIPVLPNVDSYKDPYLLPSELKALAGRKSKNAYNVGTPYSVLVIHRQNANMFFQIDLETFKLLKEKLEDIVNKKITKEQHFLFYVNHDLGPVELLSAKYNTHTKKLELVNISAGNRIAQYYFLLTLMMTLDPAEFRYELLACQANLLPSENCAQFYAYALSGILASKTFARLKEEKYRVSQPRFYDAHEQKAEDKLALNVQWFDITALGDKAIILAPTYSAMFNLFRKISSSAEDAHIKCQDYMRKYQLVAGDIFEGNFRHYYEYAYHRARVHLGAQSEPLTCMQVRAQLLEEHYDAQKDALLAQEMREKFEALSLQEKKPAKPRVASDFPNGPFPMRPRIVEEDGKVMRRAAAGFCPLHAFKFMLTQPEFLACIDAFDAKRQYTPLQAALMHGQPVRALLLLEHKASATITNQGGKSAKAIYADLPADSKIKRNEKLKALLA
ncbi:MAG: hypothetical protein JSR17_08990 [Proteobacteria bacterium]|nr:hypothetical protein [Pseudomonadota bacterium]